MLKVLGIEVGPDLVTKWRRWFAPEVQPFRLDKIDGRQLPGIPGSIVSPSAEVRDTYFMYRRSSWIWLTKDEFESLPTGVRSALLFQREALGRMADQPRRLRQHLNQHKTGGRIVWWPSLLAVAGDGPLIDYIADGVQPSRHEEVSAAVWRRCQPVLPGARRLAGTFPDGSGPNCFGTVVAAAGVPGAEHEWMFQEAFEEWLASSATRCAGQGQDDRPGTVLVWRDSDGLASHAAVTIGGDYALSKPSQSWSSPRLIWTVRDTIIASRQAGHHLTRYQLTGQTSTSPQR